MATRTINQVIIDVLKEKNVPLTANDIYEIIKANGYYSFNSKNPLSIVSNEIRKKCMDNPQANGEISYKRLENGLYELI